MAERAVVFPGPSKRAFDFFVAAKIPIVRRYTAMTSGGSGEGWLIALAVKIIPTMSPVQIMR